jgi:hypothetical protein
MNDAYIQKANPISEASKKRRVCNMAGVREKIDKSNWVVDSVSDEEA